MLKKVIRSIPYRTKDIKAAVVLIVTENVAALRMFVKNITKSISKFAYRHQDSKRRNKESIARKGARNVKEDYVDSCSGGNVGRSFKSYGPGRKSQARSRAGTKTDDGRPTNANGPGSNVSQATRGQRIPGQTCRCNANEAPAGFATETSTGSSREESQGVARETAASSSQES
jgi:hypothetical protein